MSNSTPIMAFSFLVLLTASNALPGAAQIVGQDSLGGMTVDRIVVEDDTAQSYALYLPSHYDPDRPWPVLYAMDPRGRALIPLRLFRGAAEDLGYIVVSSYNTMSDIPNGSDINDVAMEAMLRDTQRRYTLNTERMYLAGFSGTARVAWDFARRLRDNVPGIIGFGAGFPFPATAIGMLWDTSLVFYGGSGVLDFNYEEVRALDQRLSDFGFRHRVEFYPGLHAWPSAARASDALAWIELQAMRSGLTPRDDRWIEEFRREQELRAQAAADSGNLYDARRLYESMVADLDGLTNVDVALAKIRELDGERAIRREHDRRNRFSEADRQFREVFVRFLGRVRSDRNPPSHDRAMNDLDIEALMQRASQDRDVIDAQAAQRMLEFAFVHLAFYEPRFHFTEGNPDGALAVLQLARAIKPSRGDVCFGIARAHALLGQSDQAVSALECALDNGWRNLDALRTHPDLEALRSLPSFQELLRRTR